MLLEDSVNESRGRICSSQYRIRGVGGVHTATGSATLFDLNSSFL
jgi:hypothetical protein